MAKKKQGRPKVWTKKKVEDMRIKLEKWLEKPGNVFLKQFSADYKLHRDTLGLLCKESESFHRTYKEGMAKQEAWMWKHGFHGKNHHFTKWALCTLHGYKEKPDDQKSVEKILAETLQGIIKTKDYSNETNQPQESGNDITDD